MPSVLVNQRYRLLKDTICIPHQDGYSAATRAYRVLLPHWSHTARISTAMSDQCEEVCNCLACANERQRSSIQDMFGSDRNAMDTLGESTGSLHGSPVCIRATLQAEKSEHATLKENASPESASSKAATLNGMSHSLRASCSPYIETVDMQAPVMESSG